ncbi:hypothetical protein [Amycolatopsis sp. PS_44_ISF1]|nr:hypothetical protein [Amycolatopsis sp. PS_44_ISF1]MDT8909775.1 hypothetical protein [Amycolatopsis sp. PS_44_ISF1]
MTRSTAFVPFAAGFARSVPPPPVHPLSKECTRSAQVDSSYEGDCGTSAG